MVDRRVGMCLPHRKPSCNQGCECDTMVLRIPEATHIQDAHFMVLDKQRIRSTTAKKKKNSNKNNTRTTSGSSCTQSSNHPIIPSESESVTSSVARLQLVQLVHGVDGSMG